MTLCVAVSVSVDWFTHIFKPLPDRWPEQAFMVPRSPTYLWSPKQHFHWSWEISECEWLLPFVGHRGRNLLTLLIAEFSCSASMWFTFYGFESNVFIIIGEVIMKLECREFWMNCSSICVDFFFNFHRAFNLSSHVLFYLNHISC